MMDRDIEALKREEKKHAAECKKLASRDKKAMMITAKSIVQSRHAMEKVRPPPGPALLKRPFVLARCLSHILKLPKRL